MPQEQNARLDAVRAACLEAAQQAYEDAGIQGLCAEGRWEAALSAMRHVDLTSAVGAASSGPGAVAAFDCSRRAHEGDAADHVTPRNVRPLMRIP